METRSAVVARWMTFNAVGLIGVAVQLATLACLVHALDWPLPLATALAVEMAILHNFCWHQRLTWKDRPASSIRESVARLLRFHALNGGVSLCGNLLVTMALVARGVDPVSANLVAIIACSTVNFFAGDRLVFTRATATAFVLMAVLSSPVAAAVPATDETALMLVAGPSPSAIASWDRYVAAVEARHAKPTSDNFFALDTRGVRGWRERAQAGGAPMVSVDPPGAPDSKLHHWAGAIYIPRITVDEVVRRMLDHAGREQEFYQEVKSSKLLGRSGDRVRVFMRIERGAAGISATLNTEHDVQYLRFGASRAGSRSVATKIAELQNVGKANESERAAGNDRGFLWRLNAYWRFEQHADGVLIECESVSLSRSVPLLLRPIASPIVDRIARESLERTLRSLRAFLTRGTSSL
jgi:putative flippase GtrA